MIVFRRGYPAHPVQEFSEGALKSSPRALKEAGSLVTEAPGCARDLLQDASPDDPMCLRMSLVSVNVGRQRGTQGDAHEQEDEAWLHLDSDRILFGRACNAADHTHRKLSDDGPRRMSAGGATPCDARLHLAPRNCANDFTVLRPPACFEDGQVDVRSLC